MVGLAIILFGAIALPAADTLDAEEFLLQIDESGEEAAELLERLHELRRRPLDLNTCSADDLLELPFITAAEAGAIIDHRRRGGPFRTPDSLSLIEGLDARTLEKILPYVAVSVPRHATQRPSIRAELIQRWTRKLERADGFRRDSSGYLGTPNVLQTRIRLSRGKLSMRATFDKDAGEPMTWNLRSRSLGYDFFAGHIQIEGTGWIRRIVFGDFSPRFAHGVLLRAPGSVRTAAPSGRGGAASLRPYASAAESGYFRGAGFELAPVAWLALTGFASKRKIDAGIDTMANAEFPKISRRAGGLHRTEAERSARGSLQESIIGGAVQTAVGPIAFAAAFYASEERADVTTAGNMPLRRIVSGTSYSARASFGSLYVTAEWAPAAGLSAAVHVRPSRHSRLGIGVRHAGNTVYLPASVLAGGSDGLIDQLTELTLHGTHRISRMTDFEYVLRHLYRPVPGLRTPFATTGSAADVLLTHTPRPWLVLTVRGTQRRSESVDVCDGGAIRCLGTSVRKTIRIQLDYRHSRRLECRARAEYVHAGSDGTSRNSETHDALLPPSSGVLLYEELRLYPTGRLLIQGRLAVFSTDDHAARVYTYENDLLYAFSSPSFTGRGRRAYVLVRWKPTKSLSVEAKWSSTDLEDATSIGTGRDRIEGRRLREIRMQVRLSI